MKNKGFTLIELLAVITIIGILLLLGIPAVTDIIKNSRNRAFYYNEEQLKKTAEQYYTENAMKLPKKVNESSLVLLTDLVSGGYTNEIKNPSNESTTCTGYVLVTKTGSSKYSYEPNLKCGTDYVTTTYYETHPVIKIIGLPSIDLIVGDSYTDLGATATDVYDGNITANIVTNNTVNTNVVGMYYVTYTATNSLGLVSVIKREISVTATGVRDTIAPVITLVGNSTVSIRQNNTYTDQGATASDNKDGNITSKIIVTSNVNTSVEGTYTVTYNVTDSAGNKATKVTRNVIVTNDTTAPVITLLGTTPITVTRSTTYTDAGATATDNRDGNITNKIITVNPVNTAVIGTYIVTYNVTDNAGNAATQVTRTVNVIAATYTFTNATQTSYTGPTQALIDTAYAGTLLAGKVTVSSGIQAFSIATTGTYIIEVWGAEGGQGGSNSGTGNMGGKGAYMKGQFSLTSGQVLQILVGQMGLKNTVASATYGGGGGGGTFVGVGATYGATTPLIIAGGGGGGGNYSNTSSETDLGKNAITTNSGDTTGSRPTYGYGHTGGGWSVSGIGSAGTYPVGFKSGGTGGYGYGSGALGGFGGGGGADHSGGGGGGYSGGSIYNYNAVGSGGDGGGSYNGGTNQTNTAGVRTGHGQVIITHVGP